MTKEAAEHAARLPVNILLVDDQPAKLLSYEVILAPLNEKLVRANSAREALKLLLRLDIAVVLIDVDMPEIDGFHLAAMIREHPRFASTAIIFVSAVHFSQEDTMKGYEMGAVDYVSVPVVAEVLRAKVRVFTDLYRKNRQLELFNEELERRVAERTHELEAAAERQMILAREVDHRAKNALAVVQAIIRLSRGKSFEEYVTSLEGRIGALARSHTLLSESRWQGVNFQKILQEELAPFAGSGSSKVTIECPAIVLAPAATQSLSLVVHELATNAAKYGALSRQGGRLKVTVTLDGEELRIVWEERGVPDGPQPSKSGFGTRLIDATMEQLNGTAEHRWEKDGLVFVVSVPQSSNLEGAMPRGRLNIFKDAASRQDGQSPRGTVLVVEDEPLVGMMITSLLLELDYEVLGPIGRLDQAIETAAAAPLRCALIDISVAGEPVYPLAALLRQRGVRFAFLSDIGDQEIDSRFAGVPVLRKPIERGALQTLLSGMGDKPSAQHASAGGT